MAVEGPVVLRANIYNPQTKRFRSPSYYKFSWDQGYMKSECSHCTDYDRDGLPVISTDCSCGIYGSLSQKVVNLYANNPLAVWFLIEGMGTVELHTEGFRAAGGLLLGAVNMTHPNQKQKITFKRNRFGIPPTAQFLLMATHIYNIPILTREQARNVAKVQWKRWGMKWKENFF